jgi:O-antigen/teichoic acid export membrane protein
VVLAGVMNSGERFSRFASTESMRRDLRRKSVRGALFTAGSGAIDFAIRLASTIVIARLLVPEDFGLIGMVTAITGIAEQFGSLGLYTATVQTQEISHKQCSNLFWINVFAGCAFGIVICVMAPVITVFFQDSRLAVITVAISTNFLWKGLTVQHEALLSRQMKLAQISGNRVIAGILSTCVAVVLALTGYGYWALVWREVSRSILIAIGVWYFCPWLPGIPRRGTKIGDLLRFGRDLTLTQVVIAMISRLDGLIIGKLFGPIVLGLYRQAQNLIIAPVEQLKGPILSVSQPGLSSLKNDPERYRKYYQKILFVVSLGTIPLGFFAVIYANEIVSVVLGQKWIEAVIYLKIFAVGVIVMPAVGTTGIIMVTCGKSGRLLLVTLVYSVSLAVLMVVSIPWGAVGVASASVLTSVVLMPWTVHYSFSETPLKIELFYGTVFKPFMASMVMALVLVLLRSTSPMEGHMLSLLIGGGVAALVYFGSIAIFPNGRLQLKSLLQDFIAAMKTRSMNE